MKLWSLVLLLSLSFVAACTGPVFIAKSPQEAIKSVYEDPKLRDLSTKNYDVLKSIYDRYQLAGVNIYPGGIGFTALTNDSGKRFYYLLVDVRPRDISFGEALTKPRERFSEVFSRHIEKHLRLIKPEEIDTTKAEGLAFAVHWPVRDYSQCDSYGGFLEYIMIYIPKDDFIDYTNRILSFSDLADRGEVLASLDRKSPQAIKVLSQD
jgi:hypothetical protein